MRSKSSITCVANLLSLAGIGFTTGQPPAENKEPAPPAKVRYIFGPGQGKPWATVIEWLCDKTQLPFISPVFAPPSTFNVAPDPKASVPEIIDSVNNELLKQKLLLVRGEKWMSLIDTDKVLDTKIIPIIAPIELFKRGDTELVGIFFPQGQYLRVDSSYDEDKVKAPFRRLKKVENPNGLVIYDTARNLKECLKRLVWSVQSPADSDRKVFLIYRLQTGHKSFYSKAEDLAIVLKDIFVRPGEGNEIFTVPSIGFYAVSQNLLIVHAEPRYQAEIRKVIIELSGLP